MKKLFSFKLMVTVLLTLGSVTAWTANKVQVCQTLPGVGEGWHTITISEHALPTFLARGALPGPCDASAEILCDDGNPCTIDAMDDAENCLADHPPVSCDDDNPCTADSCDPTSGCKFAPISCDDGNACTADVCNTGNGECINTAIDCGPLGICNPATGCAYPCDSYTCDPVDQCHEAGTCELDNAGTPYCVAGGPKPDATTCDDGDWSTADDQCTAGVCAGTHRCPCISRNEAETIMTYTPIGNPGCGSIYDNSIPAYGFGVGGFMVNPDESSDDFVRLVAGDDWCTLIDYVADPELEYSVLVIGEDEVDACITWVYMIAEALGISCEP